MGQLIDGKKIAQKLNRRTALRLARLGFASARRAKLKKKGVSPTLAVVLVGNHKPSEIYVRKKEEAAKQMGLNFILHRFPATIDQNELIKKIKKIQQNKKLAGLIIQLPLPDHLCSPEILNAVRAELDVDCLTDVNLGKLVMKTNFLAPPTPGAILTILKELKVNLVGKNVCIVGMGTLMGKPLAIMMINERASVITCNSKTKNIKQKTLTADIIVSGVGKKNIIRGDMIKKGAIVIDAGLSFEAGKTIGDVNMAEAIKKAKFVTPTPGGVGPITVARLLYNTMLCAEKIFNK